MEIENLPAQQPEELSEGEKLPEGYYFCPQCDCQRWHEYLQSFPGILRCTWCTYCTEES